MPRCYRLHARILALGCFLPSALWAQAGISRQTHDEIDHSLRSGDPRLVAWGAADAITSGDREELPVLASLAENYQSLPPQEYDARGNSVPRTPEQVQQFDAMQAVLDAVIQLGGTVPFRAVEAVLPDFPAQAITLFATLPEPERSQAAQQVYSTRDRQDQPYDWHRVVHQQMIHVAAATLAQHPPPGFTATLLNESTVALDVTVNDDGRQLQGLGAGMCGDSFGLRPAPGWPQPYTYVVEQHWRSEHSPDRILVPGDPAITSRRALSNSSCSTLPGFTSVQRLQLAEGKLKADRGLASVQYDTLQYPGPGGYLAALSSLVARHQQPFRQLAADLEAKGLLTPAEAVRAMPLFAVGVRDERGDKALPLPVPASLGPRVTVAPIQHTGH